MKTYFPPFVSILIMALLMNFSPPANAQTPKTVTASLQSVTDWYEAVGTVRPRTESKIEARITAQVLDVKVRPGDKVQKGQVLVSLDNRQFLSRLDQARQGLKSASSGKDQALQAVAAAQAAYNQAEADYNRIRKYYKSQAATSQQLEQAKSGYLQARANLSRARQGISGTDASIRQAEEIIKEAEIALDYTQITAPEDGEVLQRMVEPGDMALPGKPLMMLQTAGHLRMEAYVREGLIRKVGPGTQLKVYITTMDKTLDAQVEEIVPYADPQTRTFLVKATLPAVPGLYPGMFGKLLIPVEEHQAVVIPENAVRRIGQLELVSVKQENGWQQQFIKTGRKIGDGLEVLSGLNGNEVLKIGEEQ